MTDTERLDFLEKLLAGGDEIHIEANPLIGSQPGERHFPYQVFSERSQHQRGLTVRHCIDLIRRPRRHQYFQTDEEGAAAALKERERT